MVETQTTPYVAVIAAVAGAAIAFVTGISTAVATHYRNRWQAEAERAAHRRELLRSKLEELVSDLITHANELEQLSLLPFPLAATLAVGSAMPWKYDEEKLEAKSFVSAQTIGSLYFPELVGDIVKVGGFSSQVRIHLNEAFGAVQANPERWLETSGKQFNETTRKLTGGYQDALAELLFKAQQKLQQEYL